MGFCNISIQGNLGKDAELKYTPQGEALLKFSVGVTTGFGERKVTTWWECTMWGKRGEKLAQFLTKGKAVVVGGEAQVRQWESNGKQGKSAEIRVGELALVGGARDDRAAADDHPRDTSAEQDTEDPPF
jgi:single-strand DNA-binding protein